MRSFSPLLSLLVGQVANYNKIIVVFLTIFTWEGHSLQCDHFSCVFHKHHYLFHHLGVLFRPQFLGSTLSSPILLFFSECALQLSLLFLDGSIISWFGKSTLFFSLQCLLFKVFYNTLVVSIVKRGGNYHNPISGLFHKSTQKQQK